MYNPSIPTLQTPYTQNDGLYNTNDKAVLYLFAPRRFHPIAIRPTAFNFDQNFTHQMAEAMSDIHRGSKRRVDEVMASPAALLSALPHTTTAIPMAVDRKSDNWTFLLIVNNEPLAGGGGMSLYQSGMLQKRTVYTGYFLDEPCVTTWGLKPTMNWNAKIFITHRWLGDHVQGIGAMGATHNIRTGGDEDIVHTDMNMLTNQTLYVNDPRTLYDALDPEVMRNETLGIDTSNQAELGNMRYPVIDTRFHRPEKMTRTIVGAVVSGFDNFQSQLARGETGLIGGGNGDILSGLISNGMASGHSPFRQTQGLQPDRIYTLSMIENQYHPAYEVMGEAGGNSQFYTPGDQLQNTKENIFSSLLVNSVLSLMAQLGLSSIRFRYNSHVDKLEDPSVYFREGFLPLGYSTIINIPDDVARQKVDALITDLRATTFKSILYTAGHFNVDAQISNGHYATCILNFEDEQINYVPYEIPTILGGYSSPIVADHTTIRTNMAELNNFVCDITGMSSQPSYTPTQFDYMPPGHGYGQHPLSEENEDDGARQRLSTLIFG